MAQKKIPIGKRRVLLRDIAGLAANTLKRVPSDAILTSPYLTSEVAEEVIGATDPHTAIVLTRFEAEVFACGGSSIDTVRRLVQRGYRVQALGDLHAKIVLTQDKAYVGSQNLTRGGTTNKEATAVVRDPAALAVLRSDLQEWVDASTPITIEMVDDMEKAISSLKREFDRLRSCAREIDTTIYKAEAERVRERERQAARERQRANERRRTRFREGLRSAASTTEAVLRLTFQQSQSKKKNKSGFWTLMGPVGTDLISLAPSTADGTAQASPPVVKPVKVKGKVRKLSKTNRLAKRKRYLIASPDTGRLAWTALNKTRLTEFGSGVTNSGKIEIDGRPYTIDVTANDDPDTLGEWNIQFALRYLRATTSVRAHFTVQDGFLVTEVIPERRSRLSREKFLAYLEEHEDEVQRIFLTTALEPFEYATAKRSGAGLAKDFCAELGGKFRLRVVPCRGWSVFVLASAED